MASLALRQILIDKYDIKLTNVQTDKLIRHCIQYEVRGENSLAFNTPLLAVHKAYFLPKDSDEIYNLFNIYKPDFARAIKSCQNINTSFFVSGNDFNLLVVWLVHCYYKSTLSKEYKYKGMYYLLKLLHYKFFTGKVNHCFPHGVQAGVMEYTIDNLSAKCDIKNPSTPTWKAIIEDHSSRVLSPDSIHVKTIESFFPDDKVVYLLSDMHTRLGTKIVNVASEYYTNHKEGKGIKTTTSTDTNSEGEKELRSLKATLDNVTIAIQNQVLNTNRFINYNDVKLASNLTNIRPDMLRDVLTVFSSIATEQYNNHTGDEVMVNKKKQRIYVGYRTLISELIQKSYRRAALLGCDMKSNVAILETVRDAYKASRILDPDILTIKESMMYFLEQNTKYTREATLISIRMAFILYIIIQSFKTN